MRAKTQGKIFAVVKADAYGHGAARVGLAAEKIADGLCAASFSEAMELADAGITKPILIFSPMSERKPPRLVAPNLIPTVADIRDVAVFKACKLPIKAVSLKLNTGMNRSGVRVREVASAVRLIRGAGYRLYSVFSHLYNARDPESAQAQLRLFLSAAAGLGGNILKHIAASNCLGLDKAFYLDAVRPGIALYGYGADGLEPVQTLWAPILKVFSVQRGERISYGDYPAPRGMRLAVIGAGYADGVRRKQNPSEENRWVSVGGALCPIAGQVCMDVTLADVTGVAAARPGGRAYFLGNGVGCESIAEAYGTNVYEVLTGFKGRIKRSYLE